MATVNRRLQPETQRSDARRLPPRVRWLFWNANTEEIDCSVHRAAIIPRVLERGTEDDVRWLIDEYGIPAIHAFLRDVGSPEIGARTLAFWRAALRAGRERWNDPAAWRRHNDGPWVD